MKSLIIAVVGALLIGSWGCGSGADAGEGSGGAGGDGGTAGAGGTGGTGGGHGERTTIEVSPSTLTFSSLEDAQLLTAMVKDADGQTVAGADVTWTTSDAAIVTVDGTGLVTSRGNGAAKVIAKAGDTTSEVPVVVAQVATQMEIFLSEDSLGAGTTLPITVEAVDANGKAIAGPIVQWTSSEPAVLSIDGDGVAKGLRGGSTAVVTARVGDLSRSATLRVLDRIAFMALRHTISGEVRMDGSQGLWAVNEDGTGLVQLSKEVSEVTTRPPNSPSWSPDASEIAFSRGDGVLVLREDGSGLRTLDIEPTAWFADLRWSPAGGSIVYTAGSGLWTVHLDGTDPTRVTPGFGIYSPTWSRDGLTIAFEARFTNQLSEIQLVHSDGTGLRVLTDDQNRNRSPAFSPDGTRIAFLSARDCGSSSCLYTIHPDGSGRLLLADEALEPSWSPDSSRLAFLGADGEVFVVPADGSGAPVAIATAEEPKWFSAPLAWSPDGSRISLSVHDPDDETRENGELIIVDAIEGGVIGRIEGLPSVPFHPTWRPRP